MSIFDLSSIESTFAAITKPIVINPNDEAIARTVNAVITNASFEDERTYHIHSIEPLSAGDVFSPTNDDNYYMVMNDVQKRGIKYKAIAKYCNLNIEIIEEQRVIVDYDFSGRPIYDTVIVVVAQDLGVLEYRTFATTGTQFQVAESQYVLSVQENENNKTKYVINSTVTVKDKTFKVVEVINFRSGIIELKLEQTTTV